MKILILYTSLLAFCLSFGQVHSHPYTPLVCTPGAPVLDVVSYTVPGTTLTREIEIEIVEPTVLPANVLAPFPTVVLSHGGAGGGTPQIMAPWRDTLAGACYVGVSIGHSWPNAALEDALCSDLLDLTTGVDCGADLYKLLNLLRPFDIAAVLDHLETAHAALVDENKIAVGGHSSGSAAALMVAGATRGYVTGDLTEDYIDIRDLSDPRPVAFLAFSPQGPGNEGFYESWKLSPDTSWDGVTRPVFLATGDGDNGCDAAGSPSPSASSIYNCLIGPTPSNRKAVFDLLPEDPNGAVSKYLFYIDDWHAQHSTFNLKDSACVSGSGSTPDALCDLMFEGLTRGVIGFLDWHLRGDPDAEHLLSLDANIPGSQGKFLWLFK